MTMSAASSACNQAMADSKFNTKIIAAIYSYYLRMADAIGWLHAFASQV